MSGEDGKEENCPHLTCIPEEGELNNADSYRCGITDHICVAADFEHHFLGRFKMICNPQLQIGCPAFNAPDDVAERLKNSYQGRIVV